MKKLLFFLIALLFQCVGFAQHLQINWQNCIYSEYQNNAMYDISLTKSSDGYFVLADEEMFWDGGNEYNYDIVLSKLDSSGNLIWKKYYGGSDVEAATGICKSDNETYIITGSIKSSDAGVNIPDYLQNGGVWFFKIDSSGYKIWDKVVGSPKWGFFYGSNQSASHNGSVLANFNTCQYGGDITKYFGYLDVWLVQINSNGQIDWEFTLGTDWLEAGSDAIPTSDGGYLVPFNGINGTFGNVLCDTSFPAYGSKSIAKLVKLDSARNIVWNQCFKATEGLTFTKAIELDNGYIIAGTAECDDGDVAGAGYHLGYSHDHQSSDIWLRKIDFNGNLIWQKCYGGSNNDWPLKLFTTSDGNLVIFGYTTSFNGDVKGFHYLENPNEGNPDIWMFKVKASTGEILMSECIGTHAYEYLDYSQSVVQNNDRNYTLAVNTMGVFPLGDRTCYNPEYGEWYAWVVNITDTTTYVDMSPAEEAALFINVNPNPAADYAVFKYTLPASISVAHLLITDVFGRAVQNFELEGKYGQKLWNTGNVSSGTYIYCLNTGKRLINGKVIITH